jgi:hypothetical protein
MLSVSLLLCLSVSLHGKTPANALPLPVASETADETTIKDVLDALKAENPDAPASVERVQQYDYLSSAPWK